MKPLPVTIAKTEIKRAVAKGTISHEDEARAIVLRHLPNLESYEITGIISNLLPKTLRETISESTARHPWFKRTIKTIVFEDAWGRVWSRTTGRVRKSTKLYTLPARLGGRCWIDGLGGMSWNQVNGTLFECVYRTNREEAARNCAKPQTYLT